MLKKITNSRIFQFFKRIRQELEDQKLNRQHIGTDRDGNKYYQYYSFYGLPTRRQILYKERGVYTLNDLVYYRWLYNQQFDPPTQSEKQKFYLQQKQRYARALQWDKKDYQNLIEFRKKRQELLLRNKALYQLEQELTSKEDLDIKTKREI